MAKKSCVKIEGDMVSTLALIFSGESACFVDFDMLFEADWLAREDSNAVKAV